MKTLDELKEYLSGLRNEYQRDNFDSFLHKIKFSFDLPFIHISGTNGKGTVGQVLSDIYSNQGYKVGYYSSPYYLSPLEMIRINGNNIPLEEFISIVEEYDKNIKKYDLSEFEVETFVMYQYFKKLHLDICIVECGMGGEDDATNIADSILSIITSISLEHTEYLGSSLTEIAQAKAGIIKEDNIVVIGPLENDALEVIKEVARENNAKIVQNTSYLFEKLVDNGYDFTVKPYEHLKIKFLYLFTLLDVSIALTAIEQLKDRYPVSEDNIRKSLLELKMPSRMEVVSNNPLVIIDGAHNPHAMAALRESLEKIIGDKPLHVIFSSFKDKNIERMFAELSFVSKDITLTTFKHNRARKKDEYFLFLDEYNYEEDYIKLIKDKMNEYQNDIILITGSLAFGLHVSDLFKKGAFKDE